MVERPRPKETSYKQVLAFSHHFLCVMGLIERPALYLNLYIYTSTDCPL